MKKHAVDEPLEAAFGLLNQLTQEQEDQLRERLKLRYLKRQVRSVASGELARNASGTFTHLIERLGSGEIDEDIKQASNAAWRKIVNRFEVISEVLSDSTEDSPQNANADDPESTLEAAYQDLQADLIQVRQAVAQAIATEKQLEEQVKRNKEQIGTWQNRAAMASQQNNEDVATQARQREAQYSQAASELEEQLDKQRIAASRLRSKLTELECLVQSAYTQKQVLIARHRGVKAVAKANKILSGVAMDGIFSEMAQRASEREAAALESEAIAQGLDTKELLAKLITALNAATAVIERMERLILEREEQS